MVRGAVQVPADGRPVVFLADHPVTGGYPVVAVLTERSSDLAAQLVARAGRAAPDGLVAALTLDGYAGDAPSASWWAAIPVTGEDA